MIFGHSNANSHAVLAAREVKAKVRVCVSQLREAYPDLRARPDWELLAFLVPDACATVNRGRRGADGRTVYELRSGRPWRGRMANFLEVVQYILIHKRASGLARYERGISLD